MKNLVVKGTQGKYNGRWVAGVHTATRWYWIICVDHDEAFRYAQAMAEHMEKASGRVRTD